MPEYGSIVRPLVDPTKRGVARELRRRTTTAECALWQALRANRLGRLHFRRQQIIAGFIVDFYCHAAGLVVEVDGPVHEQQRDYDRERDLVLTGSGLRVMRFENVEVELALPAVLAQITRTAFERMEPKRS